MRRIRQIFLAAALTAVPAGAQAQALELLDLNGDRMISPKEFEYRMRLRNARRDLDLNGIVDFHEMTSSPKHAQNLSRLGAVRMLIRFDRNFDGGISGDELADGLIASGVFASIDIDGDGRISVYEASRHGLILN